MRDLIEADSALKVEQLQERGLEAAKPNTKSDLLDLLVLSRIKLATDPRDKVYSLLGLAKRDVLAQSIIPDYSDANTTELLFRGLAVKFVKAGLTTDMLHFSGIDHSIEGLPSWAPDRTHQTRSNIDSRLYNCCATSLPKLCLLESEPNILQVRGAVIDTISMAAMGWRYYSIEGDQEKFVPFKDAPDQEIPPFTDEDSRCVILQMATQIMTAHLIRSSPWKNLKLR